MTSSVPGTCDERIRNWESLPFYFKMKESETGNHSFFIFKKVILKWEQPSNVDIAAAQCGHAKGCYKPTSVTPENGGRDGGTSFSATLLFAWVLVHTSLVNH